MKKLHAHKENILLINITRLGDMLQATPTIAGMKLENPNCKITVLVEKQFSDICSFLPNIDEVIALDLGMTVRSMVRGGSGVIDAYEYIGEVVKELRSRNFDYCLNMSNSAYTALLIKMLGIERMGGWSSDEEGYRVIQSDWAKLFASSVFHTNRHYNSLNLVDVFRCSADVELHPNSLLMKVNDADISYCEELIRNYNFKNTGPLLCVQAGASQTKRQWAPRNFIKCINDLTQKYNARVIMTGTKAELPIIEEIYQGCDKNNVGIAAGKTNLSQLAALLHISDLLLTGDTGPMHVSVAVGTPVVSMFLASAFGYETGPYSEGNLVLQPVIVCGPCNPNKSCSRPDCHDTIDPGKLADLVAMRIGGDVTTLPEGFADPNHLIVFRTYFDQDGFYNMKPLNASENDTRIAKFRNAYRKMWMEDIGGLGEESESVKSFTPSSLQIVDPAISGLENLVEMGAKGDKLIHRLIDLIKDPRGSGSDLKEVNDQLSRLDVEIEKVGYHYPELGPLTRMFIFAKENISGSDAEVLASQMSEVYRKLERRGKKLSSHYRTIN